MDRRTILAVILCFFIFYGWNKYYLEPRMQSSRAYQVAQQQAQAPSPSATSSAPSSSSPNASPNRTKALPLETRKLPTEIGDALVGNGGQFFAGWDLKNYRIGIAADTAAVSLKSVTNQNGDVELAFEDPNLSYLNTASGHLESIPNGVVWFYEDSNVTLRREITTNGDQPFLNVKLTGTFKNKHPSYAFVSVSSQGIKDDPEAQDRMLVYWTKDSIERVRMKDTVELKEIGTPVEYIGAANRYFLLTLVDQSGLSPKGLVQPNPAGGGRMNLVYPISANTFSIPLRAYFGPKELDLLRAVDPKLDHTVDFGWFTAFAYPILRVLKWLYQFGHNYGVAIILLTILLKILTYPLTYKSMKSMKEMAKIQPQLQKLREKYKDDREALNREMITLMRSHGYNPMAGCLPMVIQMPIFFALYRVLYSSIDLYHAPFAFWIHDLSVRDPYYVTPVLLSVTMFVQQKLTPNTATDPTQARMMQMMPLIFGAFMLALPSGLTLYMLVNAIASIVQQMILNKKFNAGHPIPAHAR